MSTETVLLFEADVPAGAKDVHAVLWPDMMGAISGQGPWLNRRPPAGVAVDLRPSAPYWTVDDVKAWLRIDPHALQNVDVRWPGGRERGGRARVVVDVIQHYPWGESVWRSYSSPPGRFDGWERCDGINVPVDGRPLVFVTLAFQVTGVDLGESLEVRLTGSRALPAVPRWF